MDENLKLAIIGTRKLISDIPIERRTWEAVLDMMMQNPLLEPMDNGQSSTEKETFVCGPKFFKFSRSRDEDVARTVESWVRTFINDDDVHGSSGINFDELGHLVGQTGADVNNLQSLIQKTESHRKTYVDIGVIRYPDIDQPYFKIFRIELIARSECTHVLILQWDSNGIEGDYRVRKFKPRDSVINPIIEECRERAIRKAKGYIPLQLIIDGQVVEHALPN